MFAFKDKPHALGAKELADRHIQTPYMQGLGNPTPLSVPQYVPVDRYHRQGVYLLRVTEEVTPASYDAVNGYWVAGTGLAAVMSMLTALEPAPPTPTYRVGDRKYYEEQEGVVTGDPLIKRVYNATATTFAPSDPIDANTQLLQGIEDAYGKLWIISGSGSGATQLGFVVTNDIAPRSAGTIELYDKDDIPTGKEINVYNPHDVTFYEENTTVGEEAPPDRVLAITVPGWPEPLLFPFMLSKCEQLDPLFNPEEV